MAVSAAQVTVGDTPVALHPAESGVAGGRLYVKNGADTEGDDLVLGPADVTASSGFALSPGEMLEIPYSFGERVYGVSSGETDVVAHVLRLGE
ncbi:MAG TPA: hypothetical protein VK045_02585 [Ornithinicoccus sp.]|nr:hypothetical protein [Ornithinicoccus sp.]